MDMRETLTLQTLAGADITPPPNVSGLFARYENERVVLNWQNPDVADFSHVRVLSSDFFYPTHEADGWLVYEGDGTGSVDDRPLEEGSVRYYTVFVYDATGNMSSGAVTSFVRRVAGGPLIRDPRFPQRTATTSDRYDGDPGYLFEFDDIVFEQHGIEQPSVGGVVQISGGLTTKIAVPYELAPEHLKTIVVTLTHPEDESKVFSFLLRINHQKTAYEALVGSLTHTGRYAMDVTLFDFKTEYLHTIDGTVIVEPASFTDQFMDGRELSIIERFIVEYWSLRWLLLVLLLLLMLILLRRSIKRREDRDL